MFRKRVVEKTLTKLSQRTMVKPESVRSVACLIDLSILAEIELDHYINELFQIHKNRITKIYYTPKPCKDLSLYRPQFNNRHLHWDGTLVHPLKKKVLSKKYDLLFNFFLKDNLILKSISSFSEIAFPRARRVHVRVLEVPTFHVFLHFWTEPRWSLCWSVRRCNGSICYACLSSLTHNKKKTA